MLLYLPLIGPIDRESDGRVLQGLCCYGALWQTPVASTFAFGTSPEFSPLGISIVPFWSSGRLPGLLASDRATFREACPRMHPIECLACPYSSGMRAISSPIDWGGVLYHPDIPEWARQVEQRANDPRNYGPDQEPSDEQTPRLSVVMRSPQDEPG